MSGPGITGNMSGKITIILYEFVITNSMDVLSSFVYAALTQSYGVMIENISNGNQKRILVTNNASSPQKVTDPTNGKD